MPFQVIVRELKPPTAPRDITATEVPMTETWSDAAKALILRPPYEQIYEQTVDVLDLSKLIAAVNSKPRKARAAKSA